MKKRKIIKNLLFIGLGYEIIRIILRIIFTLIDDIHIISIVDTFSLTPYIPLINMLFIVFIFLDQKFEQEKSENKKRINTYLELMHDRHKQLSNEHLGGNGTGESVLLALTVRVVAINELLEEILEKDVSDIEKYNSGYSLMNEWAKYKSIVDNYFKVVFLVYHEIIKSEFKDLYLPIFEIYLTEETQKALVCSSINKLKKDTEFSNYLRNINKLQFDRFYRYGEEMNDIFQTLDKIYEKLDIKPDMNL